MKVDGTSVGVTDCLIQDAEFQANKWLRIQGPPEELMVYLLPTLAPPLEQAHGGAWQEFTRLADGSKGVHRLELHEAGVFVTLSRHPRGFDHPYWLLTEDQVSQLGGLMHAHTDDRELINWLKNVEGMWGMEHYQMHEKYRDLLKSQDDAQLVRETLIMLIVNDQGWREIGKSRNGQARLDYARGQLLPTYCLSQLVKKVALWWLWEQYSQWEREDTIITPMGENYYLVAHGRQEYGRSNWRGLHHQNISGSLVYITDGELVAELSQLPFRQVPEHKELRRNLEAKGGRMFIPPQAR